MATRSLFEKHSITLSIFFIFLKSDYYWLIPYFSLQCPRTISTFGLAGRSCWLLCRTRTSPSLWHYSCHLKGKSDQSYALYVCGDSYKSCIGPALGPNTVGINATNIHANYDDKPGQVGQHHTVMRAFYLYYASKVKKQDPLQCRTWQTLMEKPWTWNKKALRLFFRPQATPAPFLHRSTSNGSSRYALKPLQVIPGASSRVTVPCSTLEWDFLLYSNSRAFYDTALDVQNLLKVLLQVRSISGFL